VREREKGKVGGTKRENKRNCVYPPKRRGWVGLNWHLKELTVIVLSLLIRGKRERRTDIRNTHLAGASRQ